MNPDRSLRWAGTTHSVPYLASVLAGAVWLYSIPAFLLAVLALGLAYTCTAAQAFEAHGSHIAFRLYLCTYAAGFAAGVALGLRGLRLWLL